ncbi:hypothetical protein BD324DRAFT_581631 [Kockovaella imperatae]|uniref:Uncharacterized protein n=1 Tax=Kockovaella imperatae TaxID=4999 RepID=A0A1Y1UCL5_9TREE|nr:hypothetical protein BD324DRAFT_581631 [Kockovaella imperatae]ORX35791.1 hypothetical protein BD324DRAFT_581631 [Kockovaella imperatae]
MPKRKCEAFTGAQPISVSSLDAALDLLACETFTRLDHLTARFEAATGLKLNEGVVHKRWDDAVQRYHMMKGLGGLSCAAKAAGVEVSEEAASGSKERERDCGGSRRGSMGIMETGHGPVEFAPRSRRPLPANVYPGAEAKYNLDPEETAEWKRWQPKINDVVLVDMPDDGGIWPGKIIDKKIFFQGRTVPRGNHFWPVRIYSDTVEPTVTIKSRMIPLTLRPKPPLFAPEHLLSAYNHATNPESFDKMAGAREAAAAHLRTHPGVSDDSDMERIKVEKEAWNKFVNWVMNERRVEKLRALEAERNKRLFQVAQTDFALEAVGERVSDSETDLVKRRRKGKPLPAWDGELLDDAESRRGSMPSIFGPAAHKPDPQPDSPARGLSGLFRPALSTPTRPMSPRRLAEKKRAVLLGCGEKSPRRGGTYTPPRILPSGDETAPNRVSSPVPSRNFDFVSPLGPVRLGVLAGGSNGVDSPLRGSLEVVKEEAEEDGADGWTLVKGKNEHQARGLGIRMEGVSEG